MREPGDRADRLHQRIWESLPWYVNRTLPPEEAAAVAEHAAACERCRDEIEACRSLAQAVVEAGELAPTPHPVRLTRLLRRIDEHEAGRGRPGIPGIAALLGRLRALAAPAARPLPWMLAAQLAVLVLIGALLLWPHQEPQFSTLSAPAVAPVPQVSLRVVFNRQATEEEIRRLLLSVRGEITGGPSPFGVYTVAVPAGDPLTEVLAHLRRAPAVELAEKAVEPARPARKDG